MEKRKLSTREAAEYLAAIGTPFTHKTLEVWRCKGLGPRFYKVARKIFYDPADLESFSSGHVVETNDSRRG